MFANFADRRYWYNGAEYADLGGTAGWLSAPGGTFTRSSSASYTNSSGLLVPNGAATDALRFDYNPTMLAPRGILLEGASTNLILQSNNLVFAGTWLPLGGTTTNQDATGPDGAASSAWTLTGGAVGQTGIYQNMSLSNGTVYAFSAYFKAGSRTFTFINRGGALNNNYITQVYDVGNGILGENVVGSASGTIVDAEIVYAGNGWYRCSLVGSTSQAGAGAYIEFGYVDAATGNSFNAGGEPNAATGGQTIGITNTQLEQLAFASSYIPTTGSTATRERDDFIFGPIGSVPFRGFLAGGPATHFVEAACMALGGYQGYLGYGNGDGIGNDVIELFQTITSNQLRVDTYTGGVARDDDVDGVAVPNTFAKIGYASKVGDYAVSFNGGSVVASSDGGSWPAVDHFYVGRLENAIAPLYGWVKQFAYWPTRASNHELQRLAQ